MKKRGKRYVHGMMIAWKQMSWKKVPIGWI
jgi:hypothetical protein